MAVSSTSGLTVSSASSSMKAVHRIPNAPDVYSIYRPSQKRVLLVLFACVYLLLPLSDTILLPQLMIVAEDMQARSTVATAAVSLYLVSVGVGLLVFGPVVDWCGRLPAIHAVLVIFIGSSVGCALAPTIGVLLLCRCIQGFAAAGTWSVASAVVADIFHPSQRGMAYGIVCMPGQFGPIIAPFLGASLGHAFGWRSTMWFLAIQGLFTLVAVAALYRDTQHNKVVARIRCQLQAANLPPPQWATADSLADPHTSQQQDSQCQLASAWALLVHFTTDFRLLPFVLMAIHIFACQFLLLVQLPERLSSGGMSSLTIGFCYLATGGCSMIGSVLGGWTSDRAAAAAVKATAAHDTFGTGQSFTGCLAETRSSTADLDRQSRTICHVPCSVRGTTGCPVSPASSSRKCHNMPTATARVEISCWLNLFVMPAGLLLFAWTGFLGSSATLIATSLLGASLACFAYSHLCPALFAYFSNAAGQQAGTAGSLVPAGMNSWAGVLTQINPIALSTIGLAAYDSIFAASVVVLATFALWVCVRERHQAVQGNKESSSCNTEAAPNHHDTAQQWSIAVAVVGGAGVGRSSISAATEEV